MKRRNFVGLLAVPAVLAAKNIVPKAQKNESTDEQKREVIRLYVLALLGYQDYADRFCLRLEDHTFGDGTTCVVAQPFAVGQSREFYTPALFAKTGADSVQSAYDAIMERSEDILYQPYKSKVMMLPINLVS